MNPLTLGAVVGGVLIFVLLLGAPVAFALGAVSLLFLAIFDGLGGVSIAAQTFYASLESFALLSIPMFIFMGEAVASSRAGADLYEGLERWLNRVPGGLLISNLGACAIFAALSGSSAATCAAIGRMGVPEMRARGYPDPLATGSICAGATLGILIPPSITMIVYGITTETSIGRLFIAGILPGLMLTAFFIAWAWFYSWRSGAAFSDTGSRYTLRERLLILPKVGPFLLVVLFVLWALYGGVATPSEAGGVGALACLVLVVAIYRMWQPSRLWKVLRETTRESVMIMMIIAGAGLFSYMMSSLYITQSIAMWVGDMEVNRWVLMGATNVFLLICGMFLPPVAVILMVGPTLVPIVTHAGFDPIWFAVVLTINMELGLITPPVGLNLYVVNSIAPNVRITTILWGALPFMLCMVLAILLLCVFPSIATWLPNALMGPGL